MTEEQQERLGVDKAEIDRQLEKAALAQKYQNQIAAENNSDLTVTVPGQSHMSRF